MHILNNSSEPVSFVQRLPKVFQTSMTFGTRWVVIVQTSLALWDGTIHVKPFPAYRNEIIKNFAFEMNAVEKKIILYFL